MLEEIADDASRKCLEAAIGRRVFLDVKLVSISIVANDSSVDATVVLVPQYAASDWARVVIVFADVARFDLEWLGDDFVDFYRVNQAVVSSVGGLVRVSFTPHDYRSSAPDERDFGVFVSRRARISYF